MIKNIKIAVYSGEILSTIFIERLLFATYEKIKKENAGYYSHPLSMILILFL